jgi:hypothetical protein
MRGVQGIGAAAVNVAGNEPAITFREERHVMGAKRLGMDNPGVKRSHPMSDVWCVLLVWAGLSLLLQSSPNVERDVGLQQAASGLGFIVRTTCTYLFMSYMQIDIDP